MCGLARFAYRPRFKAGTVATYSHAMLYVGKGTVVEAVANGVVQRSIKLALWLHLARWGANNVKVGVGSKRTYSCSELVIAALLTTTLATLATRGRPAGGEGW